MEEEKRGKNIKRWNVWDMGGGADLKGLVYNRQIPFCSWNLSGSIEVHKADDSEHEKQLKVFSWWLVSFVSHRG